MSIVALFCKTDDFFYVEHAFHQIAFNDKHGHSVSRCFCQSNSDSEITPMGELNVSENQLALHHN